jgi:glycosyltransferase involved in cell wall biosynthesis
MKILQIANGDFLASHGGGQVYVKNLVEEMINQQLDLAVISFVKKISDAKFEKKQYRNIPIYEIYEVNKELIIQLIKKIKPDIIHIHAHKALFSTIAKELNIPNIITAHHGGILCPGGTLLNYKDEICCVKVNDKNCLSCVLRQVRTGTFFYPFIEKIPLKQRLKFGKWISKYPHIYFLTPLGISSLKIENKQKEWQKIIQNSDLVIAPSNAIKERMNLEGMSEEKIQVIPHGIPFTVNESFLEKKEEKIRFFHISVSYEKGTHILLKAFEDLDKIKCELHIIGYNSSRKVQKLLEPYKNCSNIIFHGKVAPEKILPLINNLDVMIHSAIYLEVFGLTISEALSQNKPVIATRCGGAEMQITDKENGLLIEPNNVEALKNAMQWMIEHPEERQKMVEKAPKKVISMENHVKNIVNLYQNTML